MANEEHLAILKQGVNVWNEWRGKNTEIKPDFSGADLREANLNRVDLTWANLTEANLSKTNLSGAYLIKASLHAANLSEAVLTQSKLWAADLNGADLSGTYLSKADFRRTNLCEAYFNGAILNKVDLSEADLRKADLSKTYINEVDLCETNFSEVILWTTAFFNVDLSCVNGLEKVKHYGPSEISVSTIYKSGGKIPEIFLRGCGVPDTMITYMASLVGKPIQFYSAFISFSSKDDEFAKRLHADLQAKGVRVWFAPEDLKIGDKFRTRIDEAIRVYDKLMVVLSENSINSAWVEQEVEAAFDKERREKRIVLFPIRLDETVMETDQAWAADIRRTRHIGDFSTGKNHDHYQKAFERLLRDLQAEQ